MLYLKYKIQDDVSVFLIIIFIAWPLYTYTHKKITHIFD